MFARYLYYTDISKKNDYYFMYVKIPLYIFIINEYTPEKIIVIF